MNWTKMKKAAVLLAAFSTLMISRPLMAQDTKLEGTYNKGPLTIEFVADGKYQISMQGQVAISGRYTAKDGELRLEDLNGPMACTGKTGQYQFRAGEQGLELRAANDPCPEREQNIPGRWQKHVVIVPLAITNGTLIDGNGGTPQKGMTVVVESGKIVDIFKTGKKHLPENTNTIDATGQYIIPGLIDSHVHLATDPDHDQAHAELKRMLYGGITTVRDMAGDARSLAWLSRGAMLDEIEAPRIYYSAVIAAPSFFTDERSITASRGVVPGEGPWARAFTLDDDPKQVIAEAKGTGATAVKLYQTLDKKAIKLLSDEARKQGIRVWSDLVPPIKPSDSISGGVEVLSHSGSLAAETGTFDEISQMLDEDPEAAIKKITSDKNFKNVLKTMRTKGIILDATNTVGAFEGELDTPFAQLFISMTRAAYEAGVLISTGTDVPGAVFREDMPVLHRELQILAEGVGMKPLEILTSATKVGAMSAGIEETHGTIEKGKVADMVILAKNPVENILNTMSVVTVLKAGKVYTK